ncbi:hypothetical protein HOLleu_10672 [Holothuria leucospilota]|uniref:Uncharacterized protein n=1 Tax=Holothuria leucospilota TaxID=206669 RepID=A0A9Q1HF15_HOLLE|nr:hypothetical protein HOLleu_10672 [Holothuria leucospilota]
MPSVASSQEARLRLMDNPASSFIDVFSSLNELLRISTDFTFSEEAQKAFQDMEEQCIEEINDAITNGLSPPFIADVAASAYDPPLYSQSVKDIQSAILLFPGKIVTLLAFKVSSPRLLRTTSDTEFASATKSLSALGKVVSVRVPRSRKSTFVFLKKDAGLVVQDKWTSEVTKDMFSSQYKKPTHCKISDNIKQKLVDM